MQDRIIRWTIALAVVASLGAVTGCAKKATQAPPQPTTTPAPAPITPPAPTPETPPTPTPAAAPLRAEDLKPAFFDFDSYALSEAARGALDANARLLRENRSARVVIEGHCDERGTAEYNQALGERRAQAARDYLVNAGIDGGRLSVISYGKERPFATGADEAAWALNRRAHFTLQ
jgi:peptidoglycan-associated lipoprotein